MNPLRTNELPAAPIGERILVRPDPPKEESQVIIKPQANQYLPNKGTILAAGLKALDRLHDAGAQVGDQIWWGRFAGVIEEWDHFDHLTKAGESCEHGWTGMPSGRPNDRKWICDGCKSTRLAEHILVMNVEDILANVSLQRRIDSGEVRQVRGKLSNGATQHVIERE